MSGDDFRKLAATIPVTSEILEDAAAEALTYIPKNRQPARAEGESAYEWLRRVREAHLAHLKDSMKVAFQVPGSGSPANQSDEGGGA